jgi:aspartate--ammonia ligase
MSLIIPEHYDPKLSVRETEAAIRYIRETFQDEIGRELNLQRMSAPMFVEKKTGLNDNLNGVEQPVSFTMKNCRAKRLKSFTRWLSGNAMP